MKQLVSLLLAISAITAQAGVNEDRGLPSIPVWANPIVLPVVYHPERGGVMLLATPPVLTTDANSKNLGYSTVRLMGIIHF